jgi:GT2 family glycosyltransferase
MSNSESVHVTVVITAYDPDRFGDLNEGIESILKGAYQNKSIIVVVDGKDRLAEQLERRWDPEGDVTVVCNDENLGAAQSRNRAVEKADGEIIAFFDDDAVADEMWLAELVRCFTEYDSLAVGGKMEPIWLSDRPIFLPEEFYWLIGVTYKGFPEELTTVRNTFASNLSIRKSVFQELNGFNTDIGPKGESLLQSAEADLCARLSEQKGQGVLYNPDAVVGHKIYEFRTDPVFLLRRAFWQGVSKRGMQVYSDATLSSESDFLRQLINEGIPQRIQELFSGNHKEALPQLLFLLCGTVSVGLGYLWGIVKFREKRVKLRELYHALLRRL